MGLPLADGVVRAFRPRTCDSAHAAMDVERVGINALCVVVGA
jgi:hypothetical protein